MSYAVSITSNNKYTVEQVNSPINAWFQLYKQRVLSGGGAIINETLLRAELEYVFNNDLFNKISYLIDNSYGKYSGDSSLKAPLISFGFDDAFVNDYDVYQLFKSKGIGRGTSFVNGEYIDGVNYSGAQILSTEQIQEMYADGWDFQCHGYSHGSDYDKGDEDDGDFNGLTEREIRNEMEFNNQVFRTLGLPIPIHFAYPQYKYNLDFMLPIIAQYRKSMRMNDIVVYGNNYKKIDWWNWNMTSNIYYAEADKVAAAKVLIDIAYEHNQPCHLMGHTGDGFGFGPDYLAGLGEVLDYIYAKDLVPKTVAQAYDDLNEYRAKLFNVIEGTTDLTLKDFTPLAWYDTGMQVSKQGMIIFNESLSDITPSVADSYQDKDYHVGFWDDESAEAIAYNIPNNTPYYAEEPVTVDVDNDALIFSEDNVMVGKMMCFLTGTTPPGGLSFDTMYWVRYTYGDNGIKLSATYFGTLVDITSVGEDVKLTTYGFRDLMIAEYGLANLTVEYLTLTTKLVSIRYYATGGLLSECGLQYLKRQYEMAIDLTGNLLSGIIPVEMNYIGFLWALRLPYNRLTGGLVNITNHGEKLQILEVSDNLLSEEIPVEIGYLYVLYDFHLYNNSLYGAIPSELGNCIKMQEMFLHNNLLSGYKAGAISPEMTDLTSVNFSGNAITDADDINQILADCVLHEAANGTDVVLNLTGGTNAAPTGQGITDKATLNTAGWTVTTN